jgi:hypothetical protein
MNFYYFKLSTYSETLLKLEREKKTLGRWKDHKEAGFVNIVMNYKRLSCISDYRWGLDW